MSKEKKAEPKLSVASEKALSESRAAFKTGNPDLIEPPIRKRLLTLEKQVRDLKAAAK